MQRRAAGKNRFAGLTDTFSMEESDESDDPIIQKTKKAVA